MKYRHVFSTALSGLILLLCTGCAGKRENTEDTKISALSNMSDQETTAISATASASPKGVYLSVANQRGNALLASSFGGGNLLVTYNNAHIPSGSIQVGTSNSTGQSISSSLVLDYSGSMLGSQKKDMEAAASTFVNNMHSTDCGEIIKFGTNVVVEQPYTSDKSALISAITGSTQAGGTTALWDAIYQGILDTSAESGQRAVVAFTDGGENASSLIRSQSDLITQARNWNIPIYTIGFGYADRGLPVIAAQTGGRYFLAPTSADLAQIYNQIAQLFNNTMIISWPNYTYISGAELALTVTYICHNGTYTTSVDVTLP